MSDNYQRFPNGKLKPFLSPDQYDDLRNDDRFLYNRGPKPADILESEERVRNAVNKGDEICDACPWPASAHKQGYCPTGSPPMPKDNEAPVEVIQGDRKWAAMAGASIWNPLWADDLAESVLRGARDDTDLVQAFARHRLAYQSEAPAQGEGRLVPKQKRPLVRRKHNTVFD